MPRLKKSFRNKFVAEQIKKICVNWLNIEHTENLFAVDGKKPPQEIYLALVDEMIKNDDIGGAISAAQKAGKRGSLKLIHHGYTLWITDKKIMNAVRLFEAAGHVDGLIYCAHQLMEANFLKLGTEILQKAAKVKIK